MGSRRDKDALFVAIALMGKAFASPRRLELLDLLAQAARNVDELARASEQSTANTSQHLRALRARRRRGAATVAGPARRVDLPACRGRTRRTRVPRRRRRCGRTRRA